MDAEKLYVKFDIGQRIFCKTKTNSDDFCRISDIGINVAVFKTFVNVQDFHK